MALDSLLSAATSIFKSQKVLLVESCTTSNRGSSLYRKYSRAERVSCHQLTFEIWHKNFTAPIVSQYQWFRLSPIAMGLEWSSERGIYRRWTLPIPTVVEFELQITWWSCIRASCIEYLRSIPPTEKRVLRKLFETTFKTFLVFRFQFFFVFSTVPAATSGWTDFKPMHVLSVISQIWPSSSFNWHTE